MHNLIWLLVPASAVCWRLGGGAATTLTGINLGTDPARVLRALPAAALGLAVWWWGAVGLIALFLGLLVTGWGPFDGMGLPSPYAPEKTWLRWLPLRLGLPIGTVAHDFVGMAEAGVVCMAPLALAVFGLSGWHAWPPLLFIAAGLLFAPCYLLARAGFPAVPRFASGQAWGEVFAGALVGIALVVSFLIFRG